MDALGERVSDNAAFAPQQQQLMSSAATAQHADVFARRERQSTTSSLVETNRTLHIGAHVLRVAGLDFHNGPPDWITPALRSLSERWATEPGWDSYQGKPTRIETVVRLLNYLFEVMPDRSSPPTFTPLPDGGMQAEWHRQRQDLEIVVPAEEPPRYYYFDSETGAEEEEVLDENRYARVRELVSDF